MKVVSLLWEQPIAQQLGWVLLHSLWQGALVAVIFSLVRLSLRRASANARYTAGCLALALLAVGPLVTIALRESLAPTPIEPRRLLPQLSPAVPDFASGPLSAGSFAGTFNLLLQWSVEFFGWLAPLLAAAWCVGVLFFSLRLGRDCWWTRTIRVDGIELLEPDFIGVLNDLRLRLRITRPVRLLQSALVQVPTVVGWLRPVVLLPAATLAGLPPHQLEAILAHELAHVRRFDYLVNLFQCALETLMFYHPIVWWISRCVREERENCCDDLVVKVCGDAREYARALAALEQFRTELPELAFAASGGSLVQRIRRLLGAADCNAPVSARHFAGMGLLGVGSSLIIVGLYLGLAPANYQGVARVNLGENSSAKRISTDNGHVSFTIEDPYFIQSEFEAMQSDAVLRRVIENLNLNQEWGKKYAGGEMLRTPETMTLLKGRLDLRPLRNRNLVEVRVVSEKPAEAAKIANAVAEAYRDYRSQKAKQTSQGGIRALEERWKEQADLVSEQQKEVDRLREQLKIEDSMAAADALTMLLSAETLRKVEGLRIEAKARWVEGDILLKKLVELLKEKGPEKLAQAIPSASQDLLLQELLQQKTLAEQKLLVAVQTYAEEYTEVKTGKALVADIQKKIQDRVEGFLMGLETRVAQMKSAWESLEAEVEKATKTDIERANSSRPYFDAKRKLEELQRFRQILDLKLASEKIDWELPHASEAAIVDPAVAPLRAASPNRPLGASLVFLGILLDLSGLWTLKRNPQSSRAPQPAGS